MTVITFKAASVRDSEAVYHELEFIGAVWIGKEKWATSRSTMTPRELFDRLSCLTRLGDYLSVNDAQRTLLEDDLRLNSFEGSHVWAVGGWHNFATQFGAII